MVERLRSSCSYRAYIRDMIEPKQEIKRSLRIELLRISDLIQELSLKYRERDLDYKHVVELNSLQIKVGELIGKLWEE